MNEKKQYNIDFEKIKTTFSINDKGLKHSPGNQIKLLPYVANEKTLVSDFNGVLGSFSRIISGKELQEEFNSKEFINNVVDQIGEFKGDSEQVFIDIIKSIFLDKDSLIDFDIRTMNYIISTNADEKIARFLYSILFNEELNSLAIEQYEESTGNILYDLVLDNLPKLGEKEYLNDNYKCYLPFIRDLFIKDYKFLTKDEELYKKSLKRLLEYYYMFYISQLAIKLNQFEKVDLTKPEPVYYTLNWESTSKNRRAYKFGWDKLKREVDSLFTHAITLEFLNHHGLDSQLGYLELFNLFNSKAELDISKDIEDIFELYIKNIKDINWNNFKETKRNSGNSAFDQIYKLFEAIEYQFKGTTRARANEAYKNWYIRFVYNNFAKRRGPLGYNLNFNEEDIILMTKICINNKQKLKLNVLFEEFEKRGMFFDRDSKIKIVELYEKLNLLEKKSDSGDAQYVRSVL